jgi:NADH dehydrogenase [ubiquinone] 1 alpha subcomplex assembly factor 7
MSAPLSDQLAARIAAEGAIPLHDYMAIANAHYYATRDPLGAAGDFVTAPEVSQMFGELLGLALADAWHRAGRPGPVHYVELGPGRGTLAADALRAMARAGLVPEPHLIELSPALRRAQAALIPGARFHGDLSTVPEEGALLVIANEFLDALPVRQFRMAPGGWRERAVAIVEGRFASVDGSQDCSGAIPLHLRNAPEGTMLERRPAAEALAAALGARLLRQGGAAFLIDYGYEGPAWGDTFQAVERHARVDPFERPGERDLTAHVDFGSVAAAARATGAAAVGPVEQGDLLGALGIHDRAEVLRRAQPARAAEIEAARTRLIAPAAMGSLFKALGLHAPHWPPPAGFPAAAST